MGIIADLSQLLKFSKRILKGVELKQGNALYKVHCL